VLDRVARFLGLQVRVHVSPVKMPNCFSDFNVKLSKFQYMCGAINECSEETQTPLKS
jgi:hypothetical protein